MAENAQHDLMARQAAAMVVVMVSLVVNRLRHGRRLKPRGIDRGHSRCCTTTMI
jgi:hypothetical protein